MSLLHDNLKFEHHGAGVYVRDTDRTWWGHEAHFGGYVEALALTAMRAELDAPEMAPVTMGIQFFRPYQDGELRVEVTVLRRGRTMANASARLYSQGKLAGQAVAAFGVRREKAEFRMAEPPRELRNAPLAPDEPETSSRLGIPTHQHFQFFPRIGGFAFGSGAAAEVGGWVRPRFSTPVDEALLVMLQDLWIPAAYHHWTEPTVAVSVDITTQFRAALPRDPSVADAGLFVVLRTAGSLGGFVDEDTEIWTASGELLAQGRQMRFVH